MATQPAVRHPTGRREIGVAFPRSARNDGANQPENAESPSMMLFCQGQYETKGRRTQADSLSPLHATAVWQPLRYFAEHQQNSKSCLCGRCYHFAGVASGGGQTPMKIAIAAVSAVCRSFAIVVIAWIE
jgi:hypothetical protein